MATKRSSPSQHASEQKIGTLMKGNDGNMYIVKERSDKSKYWMKTRLAGDQKYKKPVGNNKIIFNSFNLFYNYKKNNKIINITDSFLEILKKKPKYITKPDGNAYVFGKLYDSQYYLVDKYLPNGDALIIDATKLTNKDIDKINNFDNVIHCFSPDGKIKNMVKWDNRTALKKVQTLISNKILFIGDIHDNAYHYCHFNSNNEIDSLIIDNNCLFKDIY